MKTCLQLIILNIAQIGKSNAIILLHPHKLRIKQLSLSRRKASFYKSMSLLSIDAAAKLPIVFLQCYLKMK